MAFRLTVLLVMIFSFCAHSQETENNSLLKHDHKYLKNEASTIQLSKEIKRFNTGLYNGLYNLKNLTPGLFLRPEYLHLNTPTLILNEFGYTFKYYLGDSDIYMLGGVQTIITTDIESRRTYNFGLNGGLGYDVTKKMQVEARSFYSLYNTSPDDAFEPVQLIPLQPLSLGFKTRF